MKEHATIPNRLGGEWLIVPEGNDRVLVVDDDLKEMRFSGRFAAALRRVYLAEGHD